MDSKKLQFPDIQMIFTVFELKVSIPKVDIQNLPPEARDLLLSLPPIDKGKLDKLKKDFGSVPSEQLFTKAISPFTFSTQNIKKMNSLYNPDASIPKAVAVYIYFSLMTFLFFQRQVLTNDQFTILINGLLRTVNSPGCTGVSSTFFQSMMNLAITFPVMFWDEQLIFTVCEYIEMDTNLPNSFYSTFIKICSIIFGLCNKSLTKCILITINKIYKSRNRCISVSNQSEMMQLLTPFALQPHPLIFEIMPSISCVSQCQAVLDMYVNFSSHLYKLFYEEPITIELSQNNHSKFTIPEVKNPHMNDYHFIDKTHQTFPNGFISLPPELGETVEIRQKYPSAIWNYLSIISPLLRKSDSQVVDYFIQSLARFIFNEKEIDDTIFFTAVLSIVFLMKENATPARLQVFTKLLVSRKIFDPEETIFQEGGIGPTLNYFRNQVISLLAEKDIEIITKELFDKKNQLLFTEIICRLLATNADLSKLAKNHQFYSDFMDLTFTFQTIDSKSGLFNKTVKTIRNIQFLFLESVSIYTTFRDYQFFSIFCHFLFETEITDQVLFILRKNLCFCKTNDSIEVVIERISLILSKCVENSKNDERYSDLAIKIADAFVTSMRTYHEIIISVETMFDSFMSCFKSKPSERFIFTLFMMIRLISSSDENFALSNEDVRVISDFFKQNKNREKECYIFQLSILTNSRIQRIKENDSYFIFRPQFILLFLASFGNSPLFDHFIKTLSIDCQYSANTAKRCHEGHLDTVILKFIEKESEEATIIYNGIEIALKISEESQKKWMLPMMISILSASSSNSVLCLLHRLCQKKNKLALIIYEEAIASCSMNINPIYLISSMNLETKIHTSQLNSKSFTMNFEQSFSFSFWFKLDFQLISHFQSSVTFFKVINKKAVLSAKYVNSSLVLQSELNGSIATCSFPLPIVDYKMTLEKRLHQAKTWHFIGLSFSPDNEFQSAQIFYDGNLKTTNPMILPLFSFSKLPLIVEIGTTNINDYYNCSEIGYISKFCIFDKSLTPKEFYQIYTEDYNITNNVLLFNILTPLLKSQNIIDLYSIESTAKSFIEAFRFNLNFDFLLNLKNIFTYLPFSQRSFMSSVNSLLNAMLQIEDRNYTHYLTFYSIFEAISYEPLQFEWFDKLLVNMDLFISCSAYSQLSIVSHWYSILFVNYKKLFGVKSRFSKFFIQFILNYKQLKDLLTQSIKFLTNLAYLGFTDFDTTVLFDVVFGSSKSENLHFYLIILENISSVLKKEDQEECLIFLHALLNEQLKQDSFESFCSNSVQILSAIHNIKITNANSEALILTKQLSSSREHLLELLKHLCSLDNLPNYSSLYFCLLLSIQAKEKVDSETYSKIISKSIPLFWSKVKIDEELWFLWPLILTFNIDQSDQQMIFQLMANSTFQFTTSNSKISTMQNICHFATFLSSVSPNAVVNNKTQLYLSCLVSTYLQSQLANGNIDTAFVTELINQILYSIFYHLNYESHNSILLTEYANSPFSQSTEFVPFKKSIMKRNISSVDDIIELAKYSSPNSVGHQLLFTKNGQIEGISLIQSTVPLIQFLKEKHEYFDIIKHFAMNNKMMNKEIKLFDKMKKDYSEQFTKSIESILKLINSLSNTEKQMANKISQFDFIKYEDAMKMLLIPPKGEDKSKLMKKEEPKTEYIRSTSSGASEYPTKMKLSIVDQTTTSKAASKEADVFYYDTKYCINFAGEKYNRNECNINFLNSKSNSISNRNSESSLPSHIFDNTKMPLSALNIISPFSSISQSRAEVSIQQCFLVTVRMKKSIGLQITKDELKLLFNDKKESRLVIPFNDIKVCYLSGDSKFEIHVFNCRSYLIDIAPHSNSFVTKYLGINTIGLSTNVNSTTANDSTSYANNSSINNSSSYDLGDQINRHSMPHNFSYTLSSSASTNSSSGKVIQSINPKIDWKSNFEYILLLNHVSGRSFNNPDLYPIFPQVSGGFNTYKVNEEINSSPSKLLNSMQMKTLELQWETGPHMPIKINDIFSELAVFPEIYYFAELFQLNADLSKNDKSGTVLSFMLPKWANCSQYEFVYKMRKLLESPQVTQMLPKWIDLVWGNRGTTFNQQRKHSILFTSPHPAKQMNNNKHLTHQLSLQTTTPSSPLTTNATNASSDFILASCNENVIGVVMKDRRVVFNWIAASDKGVNLIKARSYRLENSLEDKMLFACGSSILTFNKQLYLLTAFRSYTKAVQKTIICNKPVFKALDDVNFAYLADCSTICFFDISSTNGIGSSKYFSPIISDFDIDLFEVSKRFGLAVYSTYDNQIFVCSLPSGKVINSIHIDHAATKILITESWGFVVIYSEFMKEKDSPSNSNGYGEITVLNVNGSFIKKQEFPYKIDYWKAIRSSEGFDYILFQFKSDTLAAFEALYPEKQCLLCEAKDLLEATYLMSVEAILLVTKNGKIVVHPISISSLFNEI